MIRILLASPAGSDRDRVQELLESCPAPVHTISEPSEFLSAVQGKNEIVLLDVELIEVRLDALKRLIAGVKPGLVLIVIAHHPIPAEMMKMFEREQLWFFPEPLRQQLLFKKCVRTLIELLTIQAMSGQIEPVQGGGQDQADQPHLVDDLWFQILDLHRGQDD